jgi:hypothetical protein
MFVNCLFSIIKNSCQLHFLKKKVFLFFLSNTLEVESKYLSLSLCSVHGKTVVHNQNNNKKDRMDNIWNERQKKKEMSDK